MLQFPKAFVRTSCLRALLCACFLFAQSSQAYDVVAGDWFLRPVAGWSINVIRVQDVGSESPSSSMILGLDAEYAVHRLWGVIAGLRPTFAPGSMEIVTLGGGKYRFPLQIPFVPYISTAATLSFLIPFEKGKSMHTNLGLQPAVGFDYFVLHDLAVGLATAVQPSMAFANGKTHFELAVQLVLGITWRL
ncbi:MAG: hypothetical protein AAF320_02875 [Myxococcota bacterium]